MLFRSPSERTDSPISHRFCHSGMLEVNPFVSPIHFVHPALTKCPLLRTRCCPMQDLLLSPALAPIEAALSLNPYEASHDGVEFANARLSSRPSATDSCLSSLVHAHPPRLGITLTSPWLRLYFLLILVLLVAIFLPH